MHEGQTTGTQAVLASTQAVLKRYSAALKKYESSTQPDSGGTPEVHKRRLQNLDVRRRAVGENGSVLA
jgi:hypothetical protein